MPITGSGLSSANAVAANTSGDVYVTGSYVNSATFGSTVLTSAGKADIFLAKWSTATNSWLWAVSAGGTADDISNGVAVNGSNIYITGTFRGSFTIGSSTLTTSKSDNDELFVAKFYDKGASVSACNALQGHALADEEANAIAVNPVTGTVYVAGAFAGSSTISGSKLTSAGGLDLFVARYPDAGMNASSNLAEGGAVRGGSTESDEADGIAVSSTGTIYVTGSVQGSDTANTVAGTATPDYKTTGALTLLVAKYTDSGSSLVGGGASFAGVGAIPATCNGLGIATNGTTVYVAGQYNGTATFGSTTLTSPGTPQMFVAKYTDEGGPAATGGGLRAVEALSNVNSKNSTGEAHAIAAIGNTVYATGIFGFGPYGGANSYVHTGQIFLAKYTDEGGLNATGTLIGGLDGNADYSNQTYINQGLGVAITGSTVAVTGTIEVVQLRWTV